MTEPKATQTRVRPRNLLGVLAFLRAYPAPVVLSVSLLLINIAVELSLPQILGSAITQLRWHIEWGARLDLRTCVLLFVSLVLVRAGNGILLGPIRNRLIQRTLGDVRAAIYDSLQRLALRYHDQSNTGELISRSTTDVLRLQDFLFACLFLSFDIAVALVLTVALIFATSAALGVLTLLTLVPTIALITFFASKLQPRWRKVHDLHGAMTTVIQENIAGVRVVKAFAKETAEIEKFRSRKELFLSTLLDTVNYWAARVPFAQFVFGLGLPLALWVGGRQVIRGHLLIGDLAKVLFYLMAIGHRVGMVGQFTNIIQNASASAERILEIIREPQLIKSGKRDLPGLALAAKQPTPNPSKEGSERSSAPCQFPSWEGLGVGSWPQRAVARPRGLSLNLLGHQIAASLGKSGAEDALQTLTRGPLTQPRARSVWSASDLSALSRSGAGYSVVQGLNACE